MTTAAELTGLGFALTPAQAAALDAYLDLLEKWNRVHNLTAVRDRAQMVTRHLADSLSVREWIAGQRVADVGSGAGLPGVPLAIVLPETHFALVEPRAKRVRFLRQVAIELRLHNVEVVASRAEDHQPAVPYDCVVTRAFAALSDMLAATRHLLRPGGLWVAMKGRIDTSELATVAPGLAPRIERLNAAGTAAERHAVLLTRPV